MKLAVLSDIHVLGPGEAERTREIHARLGEGHPPLRRRWHRGLHRVRRRFWNWHPEEREACFERALETLAAFAPEWVVACGDYGGDAHGVGVSDAHTFESVHRVMTRMRRAFPGRCRFVFGDHELGKYSTELRRGGIRLASLTRGEHELGLRSFWHEVDGEFHLIGVNSTLFTLELFLPEALPEEIPQWRRYRTRHLEEVAAAFRGLPPRARVVLFCHDPSALGLLHQLPEVHARLGQIAHTVLGHLHAPRLLHVARVFGRLPRMNPKYPVARILAHGTRGAHLWKHFKPVVCPSPFGAGHHLRGGWLALQTDAAGRLHVRKHKLLHPGREGA